MKINNNRVKKLKKKKSKLVNIKINNSFSRKSIENCNTKGNLTNIYSPNNKLKNKKNLSKNYYKIIEFPKNEYNLNIINNKLNLISPVSWKKSKNNGLINNFFKNVNKKKKSSINNSLNKKLKIVSKEKIKKNRNVTLNEFSLNNNSNFNKKNSKKSLYNKLKKIIVCDKNKINLNKAKSKSKIIKLKSKNNLPLEKIKKITKNLKPKEKKDNSNYIRINSQEKDNKYFNKKLHFKEKFRSLEKKVVVDNFKIKNKKKIILRDDEKINIKAKNLFEEICSKNPNKIKIIKQKIKKKFKNYDKSKLIKYDTSIDDYIIDKLLGKGNFGKVYHGTQIITNTPVAIKIISKKNINKEKVNNKIILEISILKEVFGHNNVIKLFEVFEDDENIFMVFEYAVNGDILSFLKDNGILYEDEAKRLIWEIFKGVEHIHKLKIFHRDLKLDNILLSEDGTPKIADFGISLKVNNKPIYDTAGTPAYLSPEIIKAKGKANYKSDVWALGVLWYALVYGTVPFKSDDVQKLYKLIILGKYEFPEDEDIEVSKTFISFLEKLLTYKIKERISIKDAINDKWFDEVRDITLNNNILDIEKVNIKKSSIIIKVLNLFGFPTNYIIESLENNSFNHIWGAYFSLYNNLIN